MTIRDERKMWPFSEFNWWRTFGQYGGPTAIGLTAAVIGSAALGATAYSIARDWLPPIVNWFRDQETVREERLDVLTTEAKQVRRDIKELQEAREEAENQSFDDDKSGRSFRFRAPERTPDARPMPNAGGAHGVYK